jgi:hypothetical protein
MFRNHVLGVPVWPVVVVFAAVTLLVLTMSRRGTPQCGRKVRTRGKVSSTTRPGRHFVTSWRSQALPSGSLNEAQEA